ncbi:hypothetical protein LJC13_02125 [Peptostreptococcaceae bacterium OttesenSCG-928-C18]|nr:hypothetical protein [Peptostreptococcaceae bacterium OttesenSCG-928-C18]
MKDTNKKDSNSIIIGIVLYVIAISDIIINTLIAHFFNNGVPKISNSIIVGPLVINPISVFSALALGTIFVILGIISKKRNSHD